MTPTTKTSSDQDVTELPSVLKKEVVVRYRRAQGQVSEKGTGQVGGSKNDTAETILAVANANATGGQVNIGQSNKIQLGAIIVQKALSKT